MGFLNSSSPAFVRNKLGLFSTKKRSIFIGGKQTFPTLLETRKFK